MAYADYYERALTNGVLGIQRGTEPGVMIHMLPQHPGSSKGKSYHGWGTLYDTFWCCYGTGVESVTRLILSCLLILSPFLNHFLLLINRIVLLHTVHFDFFHMIFNPMRIIPSFVASEVFKYF